MECVKTVPPNEAGLGLTGVKSELLRAFDAREFAVEGAEGSVAADAGEVEEEAVGESKGGFGAVELKGRTDCVFILKDEVPVGEEHLDGSRKLLG